jgi:flagellar basal body-associated protein FliL
MKATGASNFAATDSPDHRNMLRRTPLAAAFVAPLVLATAFLGAAPAAIAAEAKKGGKVDVGQYVELQPVGLPIVVKNQLVNYVFVYVRINLTSGANVARLREKEPYFRDALVRAAHRTPFTLPSDLSKIDADKLTATLAREAAGIAGPGQIASVVVTSQAPRRRVGSPPA